MKSVLVRELPVNVQNYLGELERNQKDQRKHGVPIFYRKGDEAFWISDFVLKDLALFEQSVPNLVLYRGGGLIIPKTDYGYVTVFDARYGWIKLPGGIADFSEGEDLTKAAFREVVKEELEIYRDDMRLIPKMSEITFLGDFFNEFNKAYEYVCLLKIRGKNLSIKSTDGGIRRKLFVINSKGIIVGCFTNRGSFETIDKKYPIHPTLEQILEMKEL